MAEMSESAARRKVQWYAKDPVGGFISWCQECAVVQGGSDGVGTLAVPFKLWPEQQRFARALAEERYLIALKGRQIGITTETLMWFLFKSLYWFDQDFRVVSLNEKEAKDALERVKFAIANLPEWTQPDLEISNTTTIRIGNTGSTIRAMASTKNAGRGTTLSGLLLDEDAAQVYSDQIITAALPALEKRRGQLIRVSTANGVGNPFEREWRKAEQGTGRFKSIFISWRGDPNRDDKWYAEELERNGREFCQQEYPNTPEEAFLASGRPYFDMDRVQRDLSGKLPDFEDGYLERRDDGTIEFVRQAKGVVRVWKHPERGKRYVIFSDVSEGLESGDYSAAYCVPVGEERTECARVHGKMDPGELADVLELLGLWYTYVPNLGQEDDSAGSPALLAVEANNHGILTNDVLKSRGYRRLYMQRNLDTAAVDPSGRAGWLTTGGANGTRRRMLGSLQQGYRLGQDRVIDRELLEEMANFFHRGVAGKAQAGPGQHDDRVMARAGASIVAKMESQPQARDRREYASEGERARVEELERLSQQNRFEMAGVVELGG